MHLPGDVASVTAAFVRSADRRAPGPALRSFTFANLTSY